MDNSESYLKERANLSYSEIKLILNELYYKFSSMPVSKNNPYVFPFEIKNNMIYDDDNLVYKLQRISEHMCYYLGLFTIPRLAYIDEGYNKQNKIFTCDQNGTIHSYDKESDFWWTVWKKLSDNSCK